MMVFELIIKSDDKVDYEDQCSNLSVQTDNYQNGSNTFDEGNDFVVCVLFWF